MVYDVKRDEVTQEQWDEMKKIIRENVCPDCGAELQIHTNPEKATIEVGCLNPEHHGYIERSTYTQELRRGAEIHPAIRNNIERKMILPGGQPVEVALAMIQTRFPRADMDEPSAALFLWDCVRLDLDPLLGEIFPATFKVKGKDNIEHKVVQPIISEDGWLSLAARACPEAWVGPPKTMRLEEYLSSLPENKDKPREEILSIAKEIKADLCKDPEAYVWVAIGHRKDQEDTIGYGWYKKSEEGVVAKHLPGNQARVRAIKRWVREVFPEAKAKMKEMTAAWMERAKDVKEVQQIIEAEYRVIIEPEPEGDKKTSGVAIGKVGAATPSKAKAQATKTQAALAAEEKPQGEAIEGEGFHIDLTWLKESQKALKWTDDTCKTFLVSKYKVSPQGTLTEVLQRLTREQAEDFVKEINSRREKQTSLF